MSENLTAVANELQESWQKLSQHWQQTTQIWDDAVRWKFEKVFWQSLDIQIKATYEDMQRLAHVINQAQQGVH